MQTVTNNNQIDGTLVANAFSVSVVSQLRVATPAPPPSSGTVVATPEPASLAVLGVGLTALGGSAAAGREEPQPNGFRLCSIVGISSDTVGWM